MFANGKMIENLEARQLLSGASPTVSLYDSTLIVTGTDNIYRPDTITVLENVPNQKYVVTVNGRVLKVVNAALVQHIYVDAKAGDDVIKVDASMFQADAVIKGGEGDDFMTGGLEQDQFVGGGGADTANYGLDSRRGGTAMDDDAHAAFCRKYDLGVWVTLDGNANDGVQTKGFPSAKENDNVGIDVENVIGTDCNDVLKGTLYTWKGRVYDDVDNMLDGRGGDDQLYGFGGDDQLIGGTGCDQMFGGFGSDTLDAHDGAADAYIDGGGGGWDDAIIDEVDLAFLGGSFSDLLVYP